MLNISRRRAFTQSLGVWTAAGIMVLLAGCEAESRPVRFEQHAWTSLLHVDGVELMTDHYAIRTTSQDETLRAYLPAFMESAYAEYRKLVPPERPSPDPMVVYLFGERAEWAAFTKGFVPAQAHTYLYIQSGGYMDQATDTAVAWDIGRDRALSLLAHEGLHQYLAKYLDRPVPPWLNEGLATQFEDFDLNGDRPQFRPERNLMRRNSLREALALEDGLVPLPQLLSMHAGQAVTHTGQPARGYYAQVWMTVLFLRTSPMYGDGFRRLLADAGTERLQHSTSGYRAATPAAAKMSDGEVVFRQYVTEDLDGFEADCEAFARKLVF